MPVNTSGYTLIVGPDVNGQFQSVPNGGTYTLPAPAPGTPQTPVLALLDGTGKLPVGEVPDLSATYAWSTNRTYDVERYGTVDLTGAADSSAAVLAAIAAAATTGGTVRFPAGIIQVLSQIELPHDAATAYPRMVPIKFLGAGCVQDGQGGSAPYPTLAGAGGTLLDLRYTGGGVRTDPTCGTTAASATVTDAAAVTGDVGSSVTGAGIPVGTFVGTVSAGVSFTLVDSGGIAVNATATASVSLTITKRLAKIHTVGKGLFEAEGITFTDFGTSSNPFIKTTNTTLKIHDCAFVGNQSKGGTSCDQDAIVLGGRTYTIDGATTEDSPFQGYGTVIRSNYFGRIRRAVFGQQFCNGVVVRDNNVWISCGSNLPGGAAIELLGTVASHVFGNVIDANLIEVANYPYGIKLDLAEVNTISGNGFFDGAGGTTLGYIRFSSVNGKFNNVICGYGSTAFPHVSEAIVGQNTVLNSNNGGQSFQYVTAPLFQSGLNTNGLYNGGAGVAEITMAAGFTYPPAIFVLNSGTPQATVTANIGSICLVRSGGAGVTLFVKEANNNSNLGWVGK